LHAASEQGICQTAIKKVCRRLGIMKWPYKEMRMPSDRPAVAGEGAENSDAASDETTSDLAGHIDTPRAETPAAATKAASTSSQKQIIQTGGARKPAAQHDDAEVKDAVTALLSLHSNT